jgi:hypothetical protein
MSIETFATKLQLEKRRIFLITEGVSDRRMLERFVEDQKLSVDIYSSDDVEIELDPKYAKYGGNKGRVITLISDPDIAPFADDNAVGLIDRDLDWALDIVVHVRGIYYTEFSCLPSFTFSRHIFSNWLRVAFGRTFNDQALDELEKFACANFKLRVVKANTFPKKALPSIKSYVHALSDGGFDWPGYIGTVAQLAGREITSAMIKSKMDGQVCSPEPRLNLHVHSAVEFIYYLGRKERVFDSSVSIDELYRHIPIIYALESHLCGTAAWLKGLSLKHCHS